MRQSVKDRYYMDIEKEQVMNIYSVVPSCDTSKRVFKLYARESMIFLTDKSVKLCNDFEIKHPFLFWIDGNFVTDNEIQVLVDLADGDAHELVNRFCLAMRGRPFSIENPDGTDAEDGWSDMDFRGEPIIVKA